MEKELLDMCAKTVDKALHDALTSYNSPLVKAVNSALEDEFENLKNIASVAVSELTCSDEFKQTMKTEMKKKLARVLISQYGGEIEKSVVKLKSDPATRAKITVAIDSVINELSNK